MTSAVATHPTASQTLVCVIKNGWASLAYKNKWAESLLYLMFVSGLLLWDAIELSWQVKRLLLPLHMLVGASLFTLVVGAFWSTHRRLLQRSQKKKLRQTGAVIEWLLICCCVSGFYLFFAGAPGDTLGWLMSNLHFYSSWLLAPLVFYHALRWSVLNLRRRFVRARVN